MRHKGTSTFSLCDLTTKEFEQALQEAYDKADEITKRTLDSTTPDKSFSKEMQELNNKYRDLESVLKNRYNIIDPHNLTPEQRQELEQDYEKALSDIRKIYFEKVFVEYHLPWYKRWAWKIMKFFSPKKANKILAIPSLTGYLPTFNDGREPCDFSRPVIKR